MLRLAANFSSRALSSWHSNLLATALTSIQDPSFLKEKGCIVSPTSTRCLAHGKFLIKNIQINECKTPILLIIVSVHFILLSPEWEKKTAGLSCVCVPNQNSTDPREDRIWVIHHKSRNLSGCKSPMRLRSTALEVILPHF